MLLLNFIINKTIPPKGGLEGYDSGIAPFGELVFVPGTGNDSSRISFA